MRKFCLKNSFSGNKKSNQSTCKVLDYLLITLLYDTSIVNCFLQKMLCENLAKIVKIIVRFLCRNLRLGVSGRLRQLQQAAAQPGGKALFYNRPADKRQ